MDQNYIAALENRETMYRLLGRLYLKEVDADLLGRLKSLRFQAECGDGELEKGCRMLEKEIAARKATRDDLDDLSADYCRIFLGAGCVDEVAAYPFESVYTSPGKLVCQDAYEAVYKLFKAEGLEKTEHDVLEDQLGLELSFMAHLARKAVLKAREGDEQALSDVLDRQEKFLREHLLNWVPRLCADIRACPGSDFYKAVSLVTEGFLRQEETFLCEN